MPAPEQSRDWREKYFWLIIAGIAALGIWLVTGFAVPAFLAQFRAAFGDALLIAAILAATVDQFVKYRLIREVTSNVWQYLAGHRVPVELSDYLHDSLQSRIIRRNLTLTYKFHREQGRPLQADIEISYQVENYGNKEETYPLFISEEEHKNPEFEEISCISSDPKANVPPGKGLLKITADSGVKRADAKSISVQPHREGLFYNVKFKYHLKSVADSDSDVLSFNGPTIDVTIIGIAPPEICFVAPKTNVAVGETSIYRRVFLKEQHLHVRWLLRKQKGDTTAASKVGDKKDAGGG
jgi:hypothetical protein